MNITLTGKKISQDERILAFKKDNLTAQMTFTVDTDDSWTYKLDVRLPVKCCTGEELFNIIDLPMDVNRTCTIDVTSAMVPFTGKYTMQLRGISGEQVYHSDTFEIWVKYSIDPGAVYDPVPSEFYQIEDNITEINNNPPKPGENGYWLVWDITTSQYKESDIPLPDGTLPEVNVDTSGKYLSNDGKKAYWAEVQAGTESKIDKIEVNGVEQPIVDKTVNIAVPTKTSQLNNDSGFITSAPVTSVNTKTGTVTLSASDVGAVATSDVTQTLGLSTTKVPSEKAVSDAMIHQLQITITYDRATKTYSADKTFNEIKTAYNNKYLIYCIFIDRHYSLSNFGSTTVTFIGDNADSTYWAVTAIQINYANKVTYFGTNLVIPNGEPNISGEYAPGVGAISAVCWYLRPASDGSAKYYLWEYRENGKQAMIGSTIWQQVLIDPNSYNLNIYYNGKVYEKAFFNSFSASDAPLTGKFIRMDYENGGIVCKVLSIDAYNYFMGGGTDSVIFSEQTLKVTTTTT